jgi:hypothetical protein
MVMTLLVLQSWRDRNFIRSRIDEFVLVDSCPWLIWRTSPQVSYRWNRKFCSGFGNFRRWMIVQFGFLVHDSDFVKKMIGYLICMKIFVFLAALVSLEYNQKSLFVRLLNWMIVSPSTSVNQIFLISIKHNFKVKNWKAAGPSQFELEYPYACGKIIRSFFL